MVKLVANPKREPPAVDVTTLFSYRLLVLSSTLGRWAAREYQKRFDLKLPEWRILSVVGARGPISPIEVSNIIAIDKAWISRTVPRLVKRGLLSTRADPLDRRRTELVLTDAGAEIHRAMSRVSLGRQENLLSGVKPADVQAFSRMLAALQENSESMLALQDGGAAGTGS